MNQQLYKKSKLHSVQINTPLHAQALKWVSLAKYDGSEQLYD